MPNISKPLISGHQANYAHHSQGNVSKPLMSGHQANYAQHSQGSF